MTGAPWTDRARQLAAADLCERAAARLRAGLPFEEDGVFLNASVVLWSLDYPGNAYRLGLRALGVVGEEAEGAVAAALAGTTPHPLAGLLARVEAYAIESRKTQQNATNAHLHRLDGAAHAADAVAGWIREFMPTPEDSQ